jgi:hypothetical protein
MSRPFWSFRAKVPAVPADEEAAVETLAAWLAEQYLIDTDLVQTPGVAETIYTALLAGLRAGRAG